MTATAGVRGGKCGRGRVCGGQCGGGGTDGARVEAVCEGLARQGQFLEDRGLAEWPDGTVSGRYGWRHALYQEVVYERLGAGRQARWHRVVGARLEQAYGARVQEERQNWRCTFSAGKTRRGRCSTSAGGGERRQRQAPHEVITLLTTGLGLLATLPETPARAQQELPLQLALAVAWSEVKGQAAPKEEQTYARIRALCAQVGETPQLVQMLLGVHWLHLTREALSTAREVANSWRSWRSTPPAQRTS